MTLPCMASGHMQLRGAIGVEQHMHVAEGRDGQARALAIEAGGRVADAEADIGRGGSGRRDDRPAAAPQIAGVAGAQVERVGRRRRIAEALDGEVAHVDRHEERRDQRGSNCSHADAADREHQSALPAR